MSQRMRKKNASPSTTSNVTKQGPLKAVRAFSLKNGASGSRTSNSSPTARELKGSEKLCGTGKSPDWGLSPERRNDTASPNQKDKGRLHLQSLVQYNLPVSAYRASSADPAIPYLTGQWPRDVNSYHHYHSGSVFMCDKSTQTVDSAQQESDKKKYKSHRRSSSLEHGDLSREMIRQRLQKSKEGSRQDWCRQRASPVTGVHSALSLTAPPTVFAQSRPILIPRAMHIPSKNMNRFQRNSLEGLNMEIEKLVLSKSGNVAVAGQDFEDREIPIAHDIPDGHRAPVPEVTRLSCTRSVNTQTPAAQSEELLSLLVAPSSGALSPGISRSSAPCSVPDLVVSNSRSTSVESKSSRGESEYGSPEPSQFVSSPKPDKSCPFVREPPDGCEKVRVMEDTRQSPLKEALFVPVKPQFVFRQSQDSAFCPLIKQYLDETGDRPVLPPSPVPLSFSPCLGEAQVSH